MFKKIEENIKKFIYIKTRQIHHPMFQSHTFQSEIVEQSSHILKCQLKQTSVSFVNALRRTILSDIPTVGFREGDINKGINSSIAVHENISCLHNEFLKQRISLIPVYIQPEDFQEQQYLFTLQQSYVSSVAGELMDITTQHITGTRKDSNGETHTLTTDEMKMLFPPNEHGDYILITQLRKRTPEEKIHITFFPVIGTAKEHSGFSPVCKCTYWNLLNDDEIAQEEAKLASNPMELANFQNHGKYRHYLKDPETEEANCFQFEIESIGILSANKILHIAYDILHKQLQTIQQMTVQVNDSIPDESQLFLFSIPSLEEMYAVDIQMNTFCHTMGNLLQTYFYEQLIRPTPNGQLLYVGYKKPHPLDNHIVLRIVLRQAVDEKWDHLLYFQTVQQLVKQQCQELSNYLTMTLQQLAI